MTIFLRDNARTIGLFAAIGMLYYFGASPWESLFFPMIIFNQITLGEQILKVINRLDGIDSK